jgi:hypothetical protein
MKQEILRQALLLLGNNNFESFDTSFSLSLFLTHSLTHSLTLFSFTLTHISTSLRKRGINSLVLVVNDIDGSSNLQVE